MTYSLNTKEIAELQAIQQAELERYRALNIETPNQSAFVARFNATYPKFLKFLHGLGDLVLTFSQTFIVSLGVPVVLVLLMIVEQQRVYHGIALFEVDPALSAFGAWAIVILNLTLEFTIEHIEHKAGYRPDPVTRRSLRLWARSLSYFIGSHGGSGAGKAWQPLPLSPAQRYRSLLRLVTATILLLALAGSMRDVIARANGAWYVALRDIVVGSSLSLMITWLGGLLFAAAAVLSAQGLSRYVAIRCVEILAAMDQSVHGASQREQALLISIEDQFIAAKVAAKEEDKNARERAKAAREARKAESMPAPFSSNGHAAHPDQPDVVIDVAVS